MKKLFLLSLIIMLTKFSNCQCVPTSSSATIVSCSSYHWSANNVTYTLSGAYTYTSLNVAGCDSVQTLNLTINSQNQWAWISGSNLTGQISNYGTKGVSSVNNIPGARYGSSTWYGNDNCLYLFGGYSTGPNTSSSTIGHYNDLWKYSIQDNQWTWVSGDNTKDNAGAIGTIGIPNINNKPSSRKKACSWTDANNNFWLMGGERISGSSGILYINDLWKYDNVSNLWTCIKINDVNSPPSYGTLGVASSTNNPGARTSSTCFADNSNNLYLIGGIGIDVSLNFVLLNDIWKYNIITGMWTWIGGSIIPNQSGIYGTLGQSSMNNHPGARYASNATLDNNSNIYLFGGYGYGEGSSPAALSDLWKYSITQNLWTWISGNKTGNQMANITSIGVASASNKPGGKFYYLSWMDNNNILLFGGSGYFTPAIGGGTNNDMWKYSISNNLWTWVGGSDSIINQPGTYGTIGLPTYMNYPGVRELSMNWVDSNHNVWVFGGNGKSSNGFGRLNDLWKYTASCNSITSSSNLTVCDSYTWNGITYTTSGSYSHTYTSSTSIDSIHTLNLTINNSTTNGNSTVTACNSYTWNGTTYTSSGIYTYTSLNASGCVNTATLTLTLNSSSTSENSTVTACNSYTWNGITYTASGFYTYSSLNSSGCVNTATLTLTINSNPIANAGIDQTILTGSSAILTASGGGSYLWSIGETSASITVAPTNTTTYTVTVTNSNGCTSTDVVQVSVLFSSLSVSPTIYDYGNVVVGNYTAHNLTISNNGTSPVSIDSLPSNEPFTTSFVGQTLAAGSTINIPITFTANAALIYSKVLTLYTSIGNYSLQRIGKGVSPSPSWTITSNNFSFGNVNIGNTSTYNFVITNTGNIPITLGAISSNNSVFTGSASITTIPVGGTLNIIAGFQPTIISTNNGVITINSTTPGLGALSLSLNGNGIITGTPPILKFATSVPYNNTSGVNPAIGFTGTYTYQVLYKSATNLPPQSGYPKLGIDKNGDGDYLDNGEGVFTMAIVNAGAPDFLNGEIFSYSTLLPIGSQYGYQFFANDSLGNPAVTINTNYNSGPLVTNETLDLSIYANDITFSIPNPAVNQPFTIYATVHNTSPYPASNVNIKFYRDSIYLTSTVLPYIAANSDALVSFNWSFTTDGWYPIKVWIDSGGALGETNPLNNYAIRPITVGQFSLPGSILINAIASPQSCPLPGVLISGTAIYDGLNLAGNPPVLGATVSIVINGDTLQATTGLNGYYSVFYNNNGAGLPCNSLLLYSVVVTDFTLTSTTINQSVMIPCVQCGSGNGGGGYYSFVSNASVPQCIIELTPINYQLHISNYGTLNSYHDTIKIFADGNLTNTFVEDSIVSGQTKNYNNFLTLNSGTHTLSSTHTYHDLANNIHIESSANTIYVQTNLPDLYLGYFYQNGPTGFHITNYNRNCASAGASKIYIYDSMSTYSVAVLIDSINTSSVSELGHNDYFYNKPNWTKGYHYLRLKTDAPLIITETNENNNILNAVIYVPFPELSVGTIDVSNTNVSQGGQVNFSAVIHNNGAACGTFKVRFLANGVPFGNDIILSGGMNANSNTLVSSDIFTITNACPDSITVIADVNNDIIELYDTNNIGIYKFGRDFTSGVPYYGLGSFFNPYIVPVLNTVSLSTVIHNIGTRNANNVKVSYQLNGNFIAIDTIPNLTANNNVYTTISYTFNLAGNYVIEINPDFDNTYCEINESNNVEYIYVTAYGLPDLQILSQDISPSGLNPAPGQNINIVSSVHNVGTIPSTPTMVRFYVDNVPLGADVVINSLYPGQDTTVACTALYSSMIVGPKIIKVKADVFDLMTESSESNNEATRAIIVGGAPDFARSVHEAITFSQPTIRKGDNIQICNYIRNYGGDSGTAWIKFFEQSNGITNLIDSVQFTLNDNDSTQICVNWTVNDYNGQIITRITGSNPPEYNVLNNDDSLSFNAGPKLLLSATMNPSNIIPGASATASCTSQNDGQAIAYQWYRNGTPIGGNSLNYSITNATFADAGNYLLLGTDTFGVKNSNIEHLTVNSYLTPTLTVPVVVHVMHTGEAEGTENNPSDAEIIASIDYMNTVYNGTAVGTNLGVGNTNIQFALAKRSPNDTCTNGITRHNMNSYSDYVSNGVKYDINQSGNNLLGMPDINMKNIERWDPNKYVNIWLVTKINGNSGNVFISSNNGSGYTASLGNYQLINDGIVLKSWFIHNTLASYNVSVKAQLSHEMGHLLNLKHVFEDECLEIIYPYNNTYGDNIGDTQPVTKTENAPRTGTQNTCFNSLLFGTILFNDFTERNIMSYTTEPKLFTFDQKARMLDALNTLSYRASLVNTTINNALVSLADLIITNATAPTTPVNVNSLATVSFSEKNIGGVAASANYVNIHLSSDNVLTPGQNGDVYLGQYLVTQPIAPNTETSIFTTQVLIPSTLIAGSYYLFFAADAQGNQVAECSEVNNFATATINVTGCATTNGNANITACSSYLWNGMIYSINGTYTYTSLNTNGCVNTATLNLTINNSTTSSESATACDSYTWACNGQTYNASGSYICTSLNAAGCVNTATLNLTINSSSNTSTIVSACDSYSWAANSTTYTASGTYTVNTGCATEELVLTITPSTSNSTSASACGSYTWSANNMTYTASGTYTSVTGCNTENLVLTITPTTMNSTSVSACDSYTWAINGVTYNASGTYTFNTGCASATLVLTINNATTSSESTTACNSYIWACNGQTYNASGTYTCTSLNAQGCVNTATLNLTINNATSNTTNITQTSSYTWPINNITYTVAGTYTITSLNAVGCIHTEILNLTLTSAYTSVLMTVTNLVQTSPSEFQYDMYLTNTGTTTLALRGYAWGLNHTSGINGTGYITHSFVSRDASLVNITPNPQTSYTASISHIRATTVNAIFGNEVSLTSGVPVRLGTMRVNLHSGSSNGPDMAWPGSNINPFLPTSPLTPIQVVTSIGRTQCIAICYVNYPPGVNYALFGTGNTGTPTSLNVLSAVMIPSPTGPTPFLLNACSNTYSTNTVSTCNSYNWALSGETYTNSGNYTHTNIIGTTTCINTDTLHLTIIPSTSNTTTTIACDSFTWPVNGFTYTSSGTYTSVAGCHTEILNLNINTCLNLKLFLQGYYIGTNTMTPALMNEGVNLSSTISDSIIVELRSENAPYGVVSSTKTILNTDGTASCTFPAITGNYYITVNHRNALQTWSSSPVLFSSTTYYDFTTSASKAYGSNQVEVANGVFALYSGDIIIDENIDLLDLSLLEDDINSFSYGYFSSDLNGDGNVDLLDLPILESNINNFIFSIHP